MTVFATVDDVTARFEGAVPDTARVQTLLDDAVVLVETAAGDLDDRVADDKVTPAQVKIVVCAMVMRVLRNPGGVTDQTAGPFSYSVDRTTSSGRLFLSRADRRLLGLRPGSGTITLSDPALATVIRKPSDEWPMTP